MTINTQKLRDLVTFDFELPVSVRDAVDDACDHIDAQAAELARMREIVEMAAAGNTEYDGLQAAARAALQEKSSD